jgi:hypothetical protein
VINGTHAMSDRMVLIDAIESLSTGQPGRRLVNDNSPAFARGDSARAEAVDWTGFELIRL